jgi:hypothetical protein
MMIHHRGTEDTEKRSEGPPANTVFENWNVEVDQQTQLPAAEFEIAQELRFVDGLDHFDRLDLDHDHPFHQQVEPITTIEFGASVFDGKRLLTLEG